MIKKSRAIDLVQTNARPGQDDPFNEWYTKHVHDILRVPGILTAQRYRLAPSRRVKTTDYAGMPKPFEYLAIYELEGDADTILSGIEAARAAGNIPWSPALDPIFSAYIYEPVGDLVHEGESDPDGDR